MSLDNTGISPCDYKMFGPLKEAVEGEWFDDYAPVEAFMCNCLKMYPCSFYEVDIKANFKSVGKNA